MSGFYLQADPKPAAAIPTGVAGIDEMLGTTGLPRGRIVEMFGPAACGKTTLALNWAAAAQQQDLTAVWVDAERVFDAGWAAACGVKLDDLVLLRPDTGPQAVGMVESLLRTFSVDLVVVDSAGALVSEEEIEVALEDAPPDLHIEFLWRALRRVQMLAERGRCCVVFLNQLRGGGWNDTPEQTPGFRALALYAAVRIRILPVAAGRVKLLTVKNKLGEPFREAEVELRGGRAGELARKGPVRQTAQTAAKTGSA
ncbi:MAG: DNA recombination/repair protein RecA [Acidobacteria bacterium]|nr:DNA recombination/repair protein RecA [Acidobacteriota bacterium]